MKPEEFNKIVIPMRDELKRLACSMTGDDDRAEDVVQEVMLRMWSIRATLDRYADKRSLAVTILKNHVRDGWRHEAIVRASTDYKPESSVEDKETELSDELRLISRIVEHLPPLQATVFRMKEIEGYDSREIMQITGCSAESLRKNLSRARRKIIEDFAKLTRERVRKQ